MKSKGCKESWWWGNPLWNPCKAAGTFRKVRYQEVNCFRTNQRLGHVRYDLAVTPQALDVLSHGMSNSRSEANIWDTVSSLQAHLLWSASASSSEAGVHKSDSKYLSILQMWVTGPSVLQPDIGQGPVIVWCSTLCPFIIRDIFVVYILQKMLVDCAWRYTTAVFNYIFP